MNDEMTIQGRVEMGGEMYKAGLTHEVIPGRLAAVHDDCTLKPVAHWQDTPYRNAGKVYLLTLEQLMEYTKSRLADDSASSEQTLCLFVHARAVEARFNYYREGGSLGWGDDTAMFSLSRTPEWEGWNQRNGETMSQAEFCEFVEDNLKDIVSPSGADMLQMVSEFRQRTQVEYGSSYRTSDGQQSLTYQETKTGANKEMALPTEMTLHLPVILGAENITTYEVKARLYVRVDKENHKLIFAYKLVRPDIPEQNAVHDVAEALRSALPGVKVYEGTVAISPSDAIKMS